MAGYSATPLPKKLGIKEGHVVALLDAPRGTREVLGALPAGVTLRNATTRKPPTRCDMAILFVLRRAVLAGALPRVMPATGDAGSIWVSWPKRTSGVETDVTEDVVRDVALPLGLVDVKVCAVDGTWSALRLVVRVENRGKARARGLTTR